MKVHGNDANCFEIPLERKRGSTWRGNQLKKWMTLIKQRLVTVDEQKGGKEAGKGKRTEGQPGREKEVCGVLFNFCGKHCHLENGVQNFFERSSPFKTHFLLQNHLSPHCWQKSLTLIYSLKVFQPFIASSVSLENIPGAQAGLSSSCLHDSC